MLNIKLADLRVGQIFPTNEGGSVTVIGILNYRNITVQHNDEFKHVVTVKLQRLNKGELKNPYNRNTCGIGYLGSGSYVGYYNNIPTPEYTAWLAMMKRCYDYGTQQRQPTYVECTVDVKWHCFQNFARWYVHQPNYNKGWELDKDILFENNKIYSETTCCLVPGDINRAVIERIDITETDRIGTQTRYNKIAVTCSGYIGTYENQEDALAAYKVARTKHIIALADKWRYELEPDVYISLIALATK